MGTLTRAGTAVVLGLLLTACGGTGSGGAPAAPPTSPSASATRAAGTLPWPDASTAPLSTDRVTRMTAEMQRWVDTGLLSGATVAVVSPRGTWTAAVGVDGAGAPLQPTSGMALAHVTQTFVAAEALLLAEQGRLELDAPASTYLSVAQVTNGTTVRQLLEHRSGIHDPGGTWTASVLADPQAHWTSDRFLDAVPTTTATAGEGFSEDAVNYVLAGKVIEEVTGRSVADAIDADLWTPLGLERLAYQDEQTIAEPIAAPGEEEDLPAGATGRPYLPFRSISSATAAALGVAGDAPSVARWGYALHGGQVLSPGSVAQLTDFGDGDEHGLATVDFTQGMWFRFNIDGVGMPGGITGYRSALAVYPEHQLSIAILTPSAAEALPFVRYLVKEGALLQ